jgi:transcriptional regulator with XRE-family HTH domain
MLTHKNMQRKEAMGSVFCTWLKRYREKHGLTQEQMARSFMIAVRSYVDLEHGNSFPSGLTFAMFLTLLSREEQKEFLADIKAEIEKVR